MRGRLAVAVGLQNLLAHPFRTALSGVGVVIGTAGLVMTGMISAGMVDLGLREVAGTQESQIRVEALRDRRANLESGWLSPALGFVDSDAVELSQSLPTGSVVWIQDSFSVRLQHRAEDLPIAVIGLSARVGPHAVDPVLAGRPPRFGPDGPADSGSAMASYRLARLLSPTGSPAASIGLGIRLGPRRLRIVAVGDSARKAKSLVLWVRREVARDVGGGPASSLVARLPGPADAQSFERGVLAVHGWLADQRPDWVGRTYLHATASSLIAKTYARARMLRTVLGTFSLVVILVAATGIANVLLASIPERRREIGIRRSVGARFGDIAGQFVSEALLVALLGGILGVGVGALLANGFAWFARWDFGQQLEVELGMSTVLLTLSVAVVSGVCAGVIPALFAARLPPAEAISSE
jgi:putative ABC transport system permease protein